MLYNVVFLYIRDFLLNFIFESLDDKKNNQKMDKKIKKRFQVSHQKILIVWLLEWA